MADDRNTGEGRRQSGIRRPGQGRRVPGSVSAQRNQSQNTVQNTERNSVQNTERNPVHTSAHSTAQNPVEKPVRSASPRKAPYKARKKINKKTATPVVILLVLFWLVIIFFSSLLSYRYLVDKYENPVSIENIYIDPDTEVDFKIEKEATTKTIAEKLYDLGLIKNKFIYRFLSKFNGYDGNYSAGTHVLCEGLTYDEIMVILTGKPEVVTVLFPEGFTTSQIAARLEANGICKSSDFYKAIETIDVSSYEFLQTETFSKYRDNRLDGYLFPDTYEFEQNSDPETVIYKMLNRFREVFKPEYYDLADEMGLTVDQVIIIASMVEKEAKLSDERAKIAGVFFNRLASDDPDMKYLQSCATVQYVYRKLYNKTLSTVTEEEKAISDWYNTYKCEGLTPGPICSPGLASIIATLSPEEHDYYYFVTTGDGTGSHYFSRTFEEHKEHGG